MMMFEPMSLDEAKKKYAWLHEYIKSCYNLDWSYSYTAGLLMIDIEFFTGGFTHDYGFPELEQEV